MSEFKWRKGYKYQAACDYTFQTNVRPISNVSDEFISLTVDGVLRVDSGYAWDGPSGPTLDTPNSMKASCKHDAMYQLMRKNLLSIHCRDDIDAEFYNDLLDAGMSKLRAWIWYIGVRDFASKAAMKCSVKRVFSVK